MKTLKYLIVIGLVISGCNRFEAPQITDKPFVSHTAIELFVGDDVPAGRNTLQVTSSPANTQYTWTSLDPEVATVSQTGLVTAHAEGLSMITVASANDHVNINVRVRNWVPLKDMEITGNPTSLVRFVLDRFQLFAVTEPLNASEANIQWTSSDPNVASTLGNGWILTNNPGTTVITASVQTDDGVIERKIELQVVTVVRERLPSDKWTFPGYNHSSLDRTIGYSSHHPNDGGGQNNTVNGFTDVRGRVIAMLDPDPASHWHSRYSGDGQGYPHWFIIDLGETAVLSGLVLQRRTSNMSATVRSFQFYTSTHEAPNQQEPHDGYDWQLQGSFRFDDTTHDLQQFIITVPARARYIRMYFPGGDSGNGTHAMLSTFGLLGEIFEE